MSETDSQVYFWDASNLIGQQFHWHFAGAPRPFDRILARSAYQVDLTALSSTLRSLGWTEGRRVALGWSRRLPKPIRTGLSRLTTWTGRA